MYYIRNKYCKCVHSLKDETSRKEPCLGDIQYLVHLVTLPEMTSDNCHDHHLQGQHVSLLISGTSSQSATFVATSATSEGSLMKKVWLCVCVCVCVCAQAYE